MSEDSQHPMEDGGSSLAPPDFSLRLLGFRRSDVISWWVQMHELHAHLRHSDTAKLTRIHELELEIERMRGRVRDWEDRELALNHQLESAREAFARIERESLERSAAAEHGVETARSRAEQLIELQSSVSATLSSVVQQVTATLAELSRQQPTHHARTIRTRETKPAQTVDNLQAAATPQPAPIEEMPDNVHPLRAEVHVGGDEPDAAVTAPPHPVAMAGYDAAIEREITATGLFHYSDLGALERELAEVPGVVDLHVESFVDDEANIRVHVSSTVPLAELLRSHLSVGYDIEARDVPLGAVIHCHADAANG